MTHPLAHRVGSWLPRDHSIVEGWLDAKIAHVAANPTPHHPVIKEFQQLIEGDPVIYMLFHQMFEQVPHKPPYNKDPTNAAPQVRNYKVMLDLFNHILTTAPEFNTSELVGFPINAILDWPMGTGGGYAAFLNEKVNKQFKKMFDVWASFLTGPKSTYVLTTEGPSGWFSPTAMSEMPNFTKTFVCDPSKPHYGFKSWDDFFTRQFQPGVRPVQAPDDDRVIANACESAPYNLVEGVKAFDRFWLKKQNYSLLYMLDQDELAPQFVGGTIYQAFLSALSYHCWHAPVSGTIKKIKMVPGTYYSETPAFGFHHKEGPDLAGPNDSQGYITEVATRAIVFIEADNKDIGLMCFMAIGMAEVSTCDVRVKVGQRVKKGEQIGMFHFGGSTHCLMFRKGVQIQWDLQGQTPGLNATNLPVCSAIGVVKQSG